MFDMMALAFQSDSTRISSFLLAHDEAIVVFETLECQRDIIRFHHKNDQEKKLRN